MNGDLPIDSMLSGRYSVGEVVGSGGMGRVHEASVPETGARVAIKFLHRWQEQDEQSVARFHREAKLAAGLGHENICEVVDNGVTEDGTPYLVMPLLEGQSFGDMLKAGPVPIDRIVNILRQTLSGLGAAHAEQIIHRDLKPDNIFITKKDNDDDLVKILDFGVSKYLGDEFNEVLTRTGTIPGTPAYMSPEQATGSKSLDGRIDVYATGVVLYEALTGRRPFEGDSYNEILFNIVSKPFDAPRTINPAVPPAIERVILRAMDRNPQRRFPNVAQMGDALAAALGGSDSIGDLPTVTQDAVDSVTYNVRTGEIVPRKWITRNKKAVFAAGFFVVAAIAFLGMWYANETDRQAGENSDSVGKEGKTANGDSQVDSAALEPGEIEEGIAKVDEPSTAEAPPVEDPSLDKENDKGTKRVIKKGSASRPEKKPTVDEGNKDPKEPENDREKGPFGTQFVGEYGE